MYFVIWLEFFFDTSYRSYIFLTQSENIHQNNTIQTIDNTIYDEKWLKK